jgi:hypothetical protein
MNMIIRDETESDVKTISDITRACLNWRMKVFHKKTSYPCPLKETRFTVLSYFILGAC